uniref:Si:rp71-17i16.5 n=1 Tax=Neogobius melanostomus TaxID=47308 RepID=A0A8C6TB16_9GOBI
MDRQTVEDVHWLLENWGAPESLDLAVALELLSLDFIDHKVRRLAVRRLDCLSNDEVLKYLLQLVQTKPDLSLCRSHAQSKRIGHFFFWYVRSEVLGCLFFRQRMAVLLEAYLLGCGHGMLDTLRQQVLFINFSLLQHIPKILSWVKIWTLCDVSRWSSPEEALWFMLNVLILKCVLVFQLEKCKIMASKKKPLWLEFCPAPSPTSTAPVGVIFKHGDDLRQDMLVIQTLVLMDSIWQDKSLDLNLIPYGCIATGHNIGMIETVRDAVTIAAIQKSRGGSAGAFKEDALFDWLKSKCPLQEITVETFVKSCAGYCVATYVLGIGDRHNDNIMITDKGNLFHIDFGHILGNWKRVLGVNRERVPFVLTPDFLYIMGRVKHRNSLYFDHFQVRQDICMQAYLSLRSQSHLLITLFSIMLLTGMRELSSAEDMRYLREVLQEGKSEEQARAHFLEQVHVCIKQGWQVQTNWWIHILMGIK